MPELTDQELADLQARADAGASAAAALEERTQTVTSLQTQLAEAAVAVRDTLAASDPRIPADAITGDTVADVRASFDRARHIADQAVAAAAASAPPAAAPPPPASPGAGNERDRQADTTGMSPHQKIVAGLTAAAARAGAPTHSAGSPIVTPPGS